MTRLLLTEIRRDLSRRLVRVLIAVGVLATVVVGLIVAANSEPASPDDPFATSTTFQFHELWAFEGDGEAIVVVPIVFLVIGGLFAGASMVGAEWRAGTVATLLTWEPRRVRVALAKVVAAVVLAFVISVALLVFFSAVLALVAATRGSTAGVDAEWVRSYAVVLMRGGLLVAGAACLGLAIGMIGRNTAAALGSAFAYMLAGENILRAWKPWAAQWLVGENAAAFLTGQELVMLTGRRTPGTAGFLLLGYVTTAVVAAVVLFRARDITSA
jgi:ABC-type transport system involved in multi-copper enzyme maturation permease subunit